MSGIHRSPHSAFDPARANLLATEPSCFLFRVVDETTDAIVENVLLRCHVTRYSKTPEVRHALRYTASGTHLDLPESDARGNVNFQIAGTSGVWPTPGAWAVGMADGLASLRAIESMFDEILHPTGRTTTERRIEFVDVAAPISSKDPIGDAVFSVVPRQGVQITRDARSVRTYGFVLSFTGYHRERRRDTVGSIASSQFSTRQRARQLLEMMNDFSIEQVFSQYKMATMPYQSTIASIATIRGFVEAWAAGHDSFFVGDILAIEDLLTDLSAMNRSIRLSGGDARQRITGEPYILSLREMEQARHSYRRFLRSLKANPSASKPRSSNRTNIGSRASLTASYSTQLSAVASDPRHARPDDQVAGRPMSRDSGRSGAARVGISAGMSLGDIIPPGHTSAEIVRLNGLKWPFVDSSRPRPASDPRPDNGPWVAYLGESIFIPAVAGDPTGVSGADSPSVRSLHRPGATLEEVAYGVDIMVTKRSIVFDPVSGDLRTVSGAANLVQALSTRLSTNKGFLGYSPTYGTNLMDYAVGGWTSDVTVRLSSIESARSILDDPRVGSISGLSVAVRSGVTTVTVNVVSPTNSPIGRLSVAV